jgi:hypothetical protein
METKLRYISRNRIKVNINGKRIKESRDLIPIPVISITNHARINKENSKGDKLKKEFIFFNKNYRTRLNYPTLP